MPLSMWLPTTYSAASAPVAALFAVMTKVGVHAVLRVHGVVFGEGAGESAFAARGLLLPLALATSVVGVLGALAAHSLPRLVAWLTVSSVGTILIAVGLYNAAAWSAAMYYLASSTLVIAGLFLLSELVAAQRGDVADRLVPASEVAQPVLLGLLLLLGAASVAGLPPTPGFIGKLMVLESAIDHPWVIPVWTVVLAVGFCSLLGLARAGSILFWAVRDEPHVGAASGASPRMLAATCALLGASVLMSALAAPLKRYTDAAAAQLLDRAAYSVAVLGVQGGQGGDLADTARPYRGQPEPSR